MKKAFGFSIIFIGVLVVYLLIYPPTFEQKFPVSEPPGNISFSEIPADFHHRWTEPSHPFTGAAVIDVDGDNRFEIFVGGGRDQSDALLSFQDNQLKDIIAGTGLDQKSAATHGAASSDMDNDGDVDLIVAREDGLTLYINDQGTFSGQNIPIKLQQDAVPLSVSISDIDGDGDGDIYVSVFVSFAAFKSATFNDQEHAKKNILLRNNGDLTFTDITDEAGVAGKQNTFHATFANLDGDGDQDLILSQNTGEVEIFRNNGDGTFTDMPTYSGYGFWMGLAVGDYDQDNDQDIYVSNIGTSIPDFLTSGDLKDDQWQNTNWAMLRNDGDFTFSDVAKELNLQGYGFAWGAQFEDIDLDGKQDLLVAQNYIKWPIHKVAPLASKALLQRETYKERKYYQVPSLGLDNTYFAQSPINVDINADGRPDVVWLNMDGPVRAFINQGTANFLTVRLPDTVQSLGAEVTVHLNNGQILQRQFIASTGLMTDTTPDLHFGLGAETDIIKVEVRTLSGQKTVIQSPEANQIFLLK